MKENILEKSVTEFITATAAKQPTPGGGSVAGVVGSLAVALGEMALNFTIGKKKFAEYAELHEQISKRLEKSRHLFIDLVSDDMQAFTMFCDANKMEDGPEKDAASALALAAAIDVPRETAKLCIAVLDDLKKLADKCNPWLISDLVAAAILAAATAGLCDLNVRINARNLTGDEQKDILSASKADREKARQLADEVEEMAKDLL